MYFIFRRQGATVSKLRGHTICYVQIIPVSWDVKPRIVAEIYKIVAGTYSFNIHRKRISFFSETKVGTKLRNVITILPHCTASNPRR